MRASFILCLLPSFALAFQPTPSFGRCPTLLNEVKVAKDYYENNPIKVKGFDKKGDVVKLGNTDVVYGTAKKLDYSKLTDESGTIRYIDEDTLLSYLEAYEGEGRKNTGLLVVDVREPEDVEKTGKFSPNTVNWPYASKISKDNPFLSVYDDNKWVDKYEFDYPEVYERFLVLGDKETAKTAANYLAMNTYCYEILSYEGGSEEWFADFPTPEQIEESQE